MSYSSKLATMQLPYVYKVFVLDTNARHQLIMCKEIKKPHKNFNVNVKYTQYSTL